MAKTKAAASNDVRKFAAKGRYGDTEAAHVQKGEMVVPKSVWMSDPGLAQHAASAIAATGNDPRRFIVGHPANSKNPKTGAREFYMPWLFEDQTQTAAPPSSPEQQAPNQPQPQQQAPAMGSDAYYAQRAEQWNSPAPSSTTPVYGFGGKNEMAAANPGGTEKVAAPTNTQWGANPDVNQQLAQATGYTGAFGSGGFNSWIATQPQNIQNTAAQTLINAGQANRVAWDPFILEQQYLNGAYQPTGITPPAAPPGGSGVVETPGYNFLDYGTGQQQIQNLLGAFDRNGQIPTGTWFTPEQNSTGVIFDPRNGFGGGPQSAWAADPTYQAMANMKPEDFNKLASWFGFDPNARDTWLGVENYAGQRTMDYGFTRDAQGNYVYDRNGVETPSLLEGGKLYVGSGPNRVGVTLDQILSGAAPNYNSLNLALSAGYDPEGQYGTPTTADAARELMAMHPELATMMPNSAEYNALRKPYEAATPGFNAQVANNVRTQTAQGRRVPSVPIGPTTLAGVNASGASANRQSATGGIGSLAADLGAAQQSSARYTTDQASSIQHVGGGVIYTYPNGVILSDFGGQLIPLGNGMYQDQYGLYRDGNGYLMNRDGTYIPMQGYPGSRTADLGMAFGAGGERQIRNDFEIRFYGRDMSEEDLANRPWSMTADAGYGISPGLTAPYSAASGSPAAKNPASAPTGSSGSGSGSSGAKNPTSAPTTNTGANGTQSGLGLTPGTTNPASLPYGYGGLNINLFGSPQSNTEAGGVQNPTSSADPYSWLSLLNLGLGSSAFGSPYYTSGADTTGGGIQPGTPYSEQVDFRPAFGY